MMIFNTCGRIVPNTRIFVGIIAASLLIAPSFAEKKDRTLRLFVDAVEADADQLKGTLILRNKVIIEQGTMKVTADKADVRRDEDDQIVAVLTAKPVCFRQRTDSGNWAQGVSERAEYDSRRGIVELFGNAVLYVGDDETRANYIIYNTQLGTFEARESKDRSNAGKGVRFILQPRIKDEPAAVATAVTPAVAEASTASEAAAKEKVIKQAPKAAKPIVIQKEPPKRNDPAFSRCA